MTRTALAAAISGMLLTSPALAVDLQRSTETYLVAGTTARNGLDVKIGRQEQRRPGHGEEV